MVTLSEAQRAFEAVALPATLRRFLASPAGGRGVLVSGVLEAARSVVAALLADQIYAPLVLVAPDSATASRLHAELQAWLGNGRSVLLYPEQDALPYERLVSDQVLQAAEVATEGPLVMEVDVEGDEIEKR